MSPVVIAVPHAGREYPEALLAAAQVDRATLAALEDRHADRLADGLAAAGHQLLVQPVARAWIDMNRDPADIDDAMIASALRGAARGGIGTAAGKAPVRGVGSVLAHLRLDSERRAKLRAGIGLIPTRVPGRGDIYAVPPSPADIEARIDAVHAPWHRAIADAIADARSAFGTALLIDLHSMPTLMRGQPGYGADIVIGDRHGTACAATITDLARHWFTDAGWQVGVNVPYAGAHTLCRHGNPAAGVHAIQLEIDRRLYLTAGGDVIDDRADRIARLVRQFANRAAERLLRGAAGGAGDPPFAAAAE